MEKSKVLVVGGTGYIGRRIVRASLAQGHRTLVLMRPEIGMDVDKLQLLLAFKARGARLVEASMDDHPSLVAAVRQADVVVSAMGGSQLLLQRKLVEAIKEAGNVQMEKLGANPANSSPLMPLGFLEGAHSSTAAPPSSTTVHGTVFTWSQTYRRCLCLTSALVPLLPRRLPP